VDQITCQSHKLISDNNRSVHCTSEIDIHYPHIQNSSKLICSTLFETHVATVFSICILRSINRTLDYDRQITIDCLRKNSHYNSQFVHKNQHFTSNCSPGFIQVSPQSHLTFTHKVFKEKSFS
jgi:hypothetical protein